MCGISMLDSHEESNMSTKRPRVCAPRSRENELGSTPSRCAQSNDLPYRLDATLNFIETLYGMPCHDVYKVAANRFRCRGRNFQRGKLRYHGALYFIL